MAQPQDLEMGCPQNASAVETPVSSAQRLWREYEKSRKGWPGVAITLAMDTTLNFHCVRPQLFYLLQRYQEGMIDAKTGVVLQREKDGTAPALGEYDELYEDLCVRSRNLNGDLALHATIDEMSVPHERSLKRMENIIKAGIGDYELPFGGAEGMYRLAKEKDPVYQLLEYILSREMRKLLFWMPAEAFKEGGYQITNIGLENIHVTARIVKIFGVLLTIILPVGLLIFGAGSSNIFSGIALGICVLAVMVVLYTGRTGGLRLALAYLTVVLTAVLGRQFASS